MSSRRLYRCTHDRRLAGVAAGLAEYLDLDVSLVRVLWVLSAFFGGLTILVYIVMAFVVPLEPSTMTGYVFSGPGAPGGGLPGYGAPGNPSPSGATSEPGAAGEPGATSEPDRMNQPGAPREPGTPVWGGSTVPGPVFHPVTDPAARSRGGQGGLYFGVLLIVFGAIAFADELIPGLAGGGRLWPAFIVAVGVLLIVGSVRRHALER